jgi:hypothetical protein
MLVTKQKTVRAAHTTPSTFHSPVRSPACLRLIKGTPQGRQTGVAFSLVTFFLAKQKKVTSCRATPGGVDFVFVRSCTPTSTRRFAATLRQAQGERPYVFRTISIATSPSVIG